MSRRAEAKDLAGFPLMAPTEIRDCLEALGIKIQQDDLIKPTAATTHTIWVALLDSLMDISPDMMEDPKNAVAADMAAPELYLDTLGTIMFFAHCKRLADLCRVKDFNLSDLIRPDPLRLRSVLSGVMNFAKFREERKSFEASLTERLRSEQARAEELRRRLDHINAEIGDIKAKREEDAPRIKEAKARNAELRQHLMDLGMMQKKVSGEVEALKQERFALSQEHRSRVEELAALDLEVQDAQTRLMRSPERVKRSISESERKLAEERDRKNELDIKLRDLANRVRVYSEIEEGVAALNSVQREIKAYLEQAKEKRKGNAEKRDKIRLLQNQLHEFAREAASIDRQIKHLQERFDKLASDRVKEREMFERREKELSEQRAAQQAEKLAADEEAAKLDREAYEYEQKTAEFVRDRERHHTELVKEWKMLEAHMMDYMAAMTQKLGLPIDL